MELIVEDGSGLANAQSFISDAEADEYHGVRGNRAWVEAFGDREAALCRASFYLSNSFTWKGQRRRGRGQALAWPRTGSTDAAGVAIASDTVPVEIRSATAEVALRELLAPGSLNPDIVSANRVVRKKVGPIEIEYADASTQPEAARPTLLIVRDRIAGLIQPAQADRSSSSFLMRA